MDIGVGDPLGVHVELEAWLANSEVHRQMQRQYERQHGDGEGEGTDVALTPREDHEQQCAAKRDEGDQAEDEGIEHVCVHRAPAVQTMKAITAAAPTATHPA